MSDQALLRLLLVEDDPDQVEILSLIFQDDEYEVESATNGEDALALIETKNFDVVVLDYMMPRMNGEEFLQRLRLTEKGADLPVLMLTSVATPGAEESFLAAGANDHCSKGCPRKEILQKVRALVQNP